MIDFRLEPTIQPFVQWPSCTPKKSVFSIGIGAAVEVVGNGGQKVVVIVVVVVVVVIVVVVFVVVISLGQGVVVIVVIVVVLVVVVVVAQELFTVTVIMGSWIHCEF